MGTIKNDIFEDYEVILKKMLGQFKNFERRERLRMEQSSDRELTAFRKKKYDIEEYEKTINSRTRPLRIGFVGGFSTGKSSMINSLLGEEILGVDLGPATAQITELSYGEKFEILEVTNNEDYKEISLEAYKKNSTVRVNKRKNLSHYIIKHPSKNLSRFTIVDTPGFSSTSKEDDELTKNWIETLDLLIWLFDANKVGDKTEYDKLKELGSSTKVIGVINKIDQKTPSVRKKIREEVEDYFKDEVYFYSSKKVLDEVKKSESFNDILDSITSDINYCINNSESFEINKTSSEITFKTSSNTKPYSLLPQKSTTYKLYYDDIINKIDNVRENELNLILNQRLIEKHYEFRNYLKTKLIKNKKKLEEDTIVCSEKLNGLSGKKYEEYDEEVYDKTESNFHEKLNSSFKVFYTSFFKELSDYLFYKHVDSAIFSKDTYIHMIDVDEDKENLYEFISKEFNSFLESCFNIYESVINNSDFKRYSRIYRLRSDENHIINTFVNGLVSSSVDAIIGYHRNFDSHQAKNFLKAKNFHANNIDLVVPDELLITAIKDLLIQDLYDSANRYQSDLDEQIQFYEKRKKGNLKIVPMINKLLRKVN